ncbi:Hydroxyproline-rich glycoprotein family protein [Rhynchospora pubera]|uniref:Hydroxyproline-rich glycoprotein family protein n=1 Tax=Rhynchospora pubera TaxID=906938 RepID=A0AAV8HAV4_9POAL|nr:Hydroxyproline-rich glycoprotein family protein [Rhynchospora pubera]
MGKEAEQSNPLLFLKIIVPFVFPLVGFLLPPLSPISTPSETDSYNNSIQEEEEHQQQMDSVVPVLQTEFVAPNIVRIEQMEDASLEEQIERLNNRVSDVEEETNQMQSDFSEYCNMKNYESLVEKLQIMCLGLKIEHLEDQNQRLEETISKIKDEKKEFEAMTVEIQSLRKNFEKISKRNEQTLLMVHRRMQDYEARQSELLKRNEELEMALRNAKDMIQMKEKCTSKMKELTIEQGHFTDLSQNQEMSKHIDRIRAQWAADMEEMIYIGWITTCLRHELLINNTNEEIIHEPKLEENILPVTFYEPTDPVPISTDTNEIEEIIEVGQECDEVIQSDSLVQCANLITNPEENCMDGVVRNSGKPKLIRKLKGWAKGKGKCRMSCHE